MSEVLSDERFLELFGNEPFKDLTPEENSELGVLRAKKSYLGIRPIDFDVDRGSDFMFDSEEIPALDYFAVLPAVLRAYTSDQSHVFLTHEIYRFQSFSFELDPKSAEVPRLRHMFQRLGYGQSHIRYIIEMLRQFKKQLGLEGHTYYKPDNIEKGLEAAFDDAIACFTLVL